MSTDNTTTQETDGSLTKRSRLEIEPPDRIPVAIDERDYSLAMLFAEESQLVDSVEEFVRDAVHKSLIEEGTRSDRGALEFNDHQEVVYQIVKAEDEVSMGELYERYKEVVNQPRTARTVRNWLNRMADREIIDRNGEKRGRTYSDGSKPLP